MTPKDQIRQRVLAKRLSLAPDQALERSQAAQNQLIKDGIWRNAESVGLYAPVKNEVDTALLFLKGMEDGKIIFYPRVEQGLRFYEVTNLADLKKGAWGIPEPSGEAPSLPANEPLDILLVPGIVFDKRGFRIGYGKGFYDRILAEIAKITVGLAYDFQVVESLPADDWDRQLHFIITETSLYSPES